MHSAHLDKAEFEKDLAEAFDNCDPDFVHARLGARVEIWDNTMGVHLIRIVNESNTDYRYMIRGF